MTDIGKFRLRPISSIVMNLPRHNIRNTIFYRMLGSPIIHQIADIESWSIGSCNRGATATANLDCISLED
jgi:hypothetical protein